MAIDDEAVAVTHKARAAGSYDENGNAVPGALTDASIVAAIQPASGRMLQDLPEGLREEVTYVGWTRSAVAADDQMVYGGDTFRIRHVWPRPSDGFNKFALGRSEQ